MKQFVRILYCTLIFLFFIQGSVFAYSTNMSASLVLGQADFTHNSANRGSTTDSNTLSGPRGIAFCNGKMVVADLSNNRVLVWNTIPVSSGQAANVVIGQTTMTGNTANNGGISDSTLNNPIDVACTPAGKLIIADALNHRVLIYNSVPTSNGQPANLILGQTTTTGNTANQGVSNLGPWSDCPSLGQPARATTMNKPEAIDTDGTRLVVNDSLNQRVLIWNTFPTLTDQAADVVLGQPTMTTNNFTTNCGGLYVACGPNSVGGEPIGVTISGNKLLVSNTFGTGGIRVTVWNTFPTVNAQYPDVVIGQQNFTTCLANQGLGAPAANTLNQPFGNAVDSRGRLFIGDRTNQRILVYNSIPTTNNAPANFVIGQADFTRSSANQGSTVNINTLSGARFIESKDDQLFVSDGDNNRILIFNNVIPSTSGYGVTPGNISARITWTTEIPTSTQLQYGETVAYGTLTPETDTTAKTTFHIVELTGLKECTGYHYSTLGSDSNNSSNSSGDAFFRTTGCATEGKPAPAPQACNDTAPGNAPEIFQISSTNTTATLHFTPAGEPYSYYMISYGTTPLAEQYGASVSLEKSSGAITFPINALAPNTKYFFKVRAGNGCRPGEWSNTLSIKTNNSISYLH